ncbi:YceD family protein [Mucilaginibacter sp.]
MKSLKKYSIPFTGLKLGKHEFDYAITDAFFDEYEYSLVKKADLQCHVELDKQETMLILDFHIKGTVGKTCDRCLAAFPLPLELNEQQIAKFSEEEIDEDEEIITLSRKDHEIDIAGLLYEYITVAVPFVGTCGNEGDTPFCDKEMLDRLNKLAGSENENKGTDPRWDVLKNIK